MMPVLKPAITRVINLSLSQGCFHRDWKTAIVQPLLKKIGLELTNPNYRPVSNLTFISKLIEKCMWSQLNRHCLTYKLQPDYQSAYREHYSCKTALLKLSNDVLWAFERQEITALMALDLSAAFDTVNHKVLLQMLSDKFGISDHALHWFKEYLQSQLFKVLINNSFSKEIDLKYSVPQGSAAGANIFNLYCSTLEDIIPPDLQLSGFADDHSIHKSFNANNRS